MRGSNILRYPSRPAGNRPRKIPRYPVWRRGRKAAQHCARFSPLSVSSLRPRGGSRTRKKEKNRHKIRPERKPARVSGRLVARGGVAACRSWRRVRRHRPLARTPSPPEPVAAAYYAARVDLRRFSLTERSIEKLLACGSQKRCARPPRRRWATSTYFVRLPTENVSSRTLPPTAWMSGESDAAYGRGRRVAPARRRNVHGPPGHRLTQS